MNEASQVDTRTAVPSKNINLLQTSPSSIRWTDTAWSSCWRGSSRFPYFGVHGEVRSNPWIVIHDVQKSRSDWLLGAMDSIQQQFVAAKGLEGAYTSGISWPQVILWSPQGSNYVGLNHGARHAQADGWNLLGYDHTTVPDLILKPERSRSRETRTTKGGDIKMMIPRSIIRPLATLRKLDAAEVDEMLTCYVNTVV